MSQQIVRQLACLEKNLITKLDELINGAPAPDYEIITTAWLCDEGGTDTWVRTETPYVDGVAGTPVVIDSGIACTEPAPADIIETDVELVCNVATGFYDEYRVVTTNGTAAAPVVSATTISCAVPDSIQAIQLPDVCVSVDGGASEYATPVTLFNQSTGLFAGNAWLDQVGAPITGTVVVSDPCDCECVDCGNVMGCLRMEGFDYYALSDYAVGQTTPFDIIVNGTTIATLILDYTVESDATGKASWYSQVVAAVNANSNFTMSLVTDQAENTNARPVWQFDYSGPGNETLAITENNDVRTLSADAAGIVTGIAEDGGNPFGTDPYSACP